MLKKFVQSLSAVNHVVAIDMLYKCFKIVFILGTFIKNDDGIRKCICHTFFLYFDTAQFFNPNTFTCTTIVIEHVPFHRAAS